MEYSYGFTNTERLGEFAKFCVENDLTPQNFRRRFDVKKLMEIYTADYPGPTWNGSHFTNIATGIVKKK